MEIPERIMPFPNTKNRHQCEPQGLVNNSPLHQANFYSSAALSATETWTYTTCVHPASYDPPMICPSMDPSSNQPDVPCDTSSERLIVVTAAPRRPAGLDGSAGGSVIGGGSGRRLFGHEAFVFDSSIMSRKNGVFVLAGKLGTTIA